MAKGKKRARIPRDQRKNLRLWAEGAREEILTPHLDRYSEQHDLGWVQERRYLQMVCNEFHARIDWRTGDYEEPTLAPYDPTEQVVEAPLSDEEAITKRLRVKLLNARIRRWFLYRIRRRRQRLSGLDPRKDPFAALLTKLSGLTAPPKARQGYQQYMREANDDLKPIIADKWAEARADNNPLTVGRKEPKAGFRAQVARDVFKGLPVSEQEKYKERAKGDADASKAAYEEALKAPPSNKPEDRQRCIDQLPEFLAPILRGINEHTGLHATIIMGGPIPKYDGEIRTVHVSYGRRTTTSPHFPQWKKERFGSQVLAFMVEYLETAFTAADCAASALPSGLDKAQYTIDQDAGQDEDDVDEKSDNSDSDSDLDLGFDDEDMQPPKKRRKATKTAPTPKAASAATSQNAGRTAGGATQTPAAAAVPVASAAPHPSAAHAPSPAPPPSPAPSPPPAPPRPYNELTFEEKRARNVERNKRWGAEIAAELNFIRGKPPPAPRRPRGPRPTPGAPTRRSTRNTAKGSVEGGERAAGEEAGDDESGEGPPDAASMDVDMDVDDVAGGKSDGDNMDLGLDDFLGGGRRPDFDKCGDTSSDNDFEWENLEHEEEDTIMTPAAPLPVPAAPALTKTPNPNPNPHDVELGAPNTRDAGHVTTPLVPTSPSTTLEVPSAGATLTNSHPVVLSTGAALAAPPVVPIEGAAPADPPVVPSAGTAFSDSQPIVAIAAAVPVDSPVLGTVPNAAGAAPVDHPVVPSVGAALIKPPVVQSAAAPVNLPPERPKPKPKPKRTATTTDLDTTSIVASPAATTHADLDATTTPQASPSSSAAAVAKSGSSAVGLSPVCPPSAPEWCAHALGQMTRINLGPHFHGVLAGWLRIEQACGFKHLNAKLPAHGRPAQVSAWIGAARGHRNSPDPVVSDPVKYAVQFWGWWGGLQPPWRKKAADGCWIAQGVYGKDWHSLGFWGQNGLLSVVAALYFWGCAVTKSEIEEHLDAWELAVNDVAWVFEGLALFHEAFKKRR